MKSIITSAILLALLVSGCVASPPAGPPSAPSPAPAEVTPSPSQVEEEPVSPPVPVTVPDATPDPAITPEPPSPTAEADEEDIVMEFAWETEPGIRLADATVPYVHLLADGRVRIYYGGPGGILSAISGDGLNFTKESGVRVPSGSAGSPEMIASDPTLVRLKDGRVRMYYKGATGGGGPGQAVHSVFSAVSTDGLNFEKEGVRVDSQQTPDGGWASVPEAIALPDGRVRIYYVSDGEDVGHGIVSAVSEDGLDFTREGPVLPGFVDPAVIRLAGGEYLMLAVAFPFSAKGRLTDAAPGIYSFTSTDGINFKGRRLVLAGEGNIDPAIVSLGDGACRVYYWNINDKPSAIKSIHGMLK